MRKYKIVPKDARILARLFREMSIGDEERRLLSACTARSVIVIPTENRWIVNTFSNKNIDDSLLRNAETFLTQSLGANIEINLTVERPASVTPPAQINPQKAPSAASKIVVKQIKSDAIRIGDLKEGMTRVVIVGEIGFGEKNGVIFREFKNGSCAVSFSVTDDTNGIICKKFFRKDTKFEADALVRSIKDGMTVKVMGDIKPDEFLKENVLLIDKVEPLPKTAREDNATVKRVELHAHTTMSNMDAVIAPEKLIETAADWGWNAVAVTDHGVVQAFPKIADTAQELAKNGKHIKVIYGLEGYLNLTDDQKSGYHIILLAKNKVGLENLYRLVSISHLKYLQRTTPRIKKELLSIFREGLIIGSACEAGELIQAIVHNKSDAEIEEIANFYDYLEIQPYHNNDFLKRSNDYPNINSDEDLIDINKRVAELAKKLGKPLVATCDAHFLNAEDSIYRAVIQHSKGYDDAEIQPPLYLRTTAEMLKEFDYLDEQTAYEAVVTNPNKIADEIEYLKPIPDSLYSPVVPGSDNDIREMSYRRARKLYGENLPAIVEERLEQELKPIIAHGFSGLYLVAHKLVKNSNDNGYLVGSRGSVGSSFVATMTGITEVNPLPPHWRCPKCQYSKFITDGSVGCGYDLDDKDCPVCGYPMIKDGHDIPFAVFLGFDGDKVPDIDLNFSGDYQPVAHKYTEVLFGRHNVYRAGSIMTVADKTAFGLVKKFYGDKNIKKHGSFVAKIAQGCMGVKRTTSQHPAGIMVVPRDMDIHFFSPLQYPADNVGRAITTHFDYHSISSRLVKLDILGHDDPTVIKMLEDITHIDPKTIPLDDKPTLSLFTSTEVIGLKPAQIGNRSGTFGIPEFRTEFTRNMLDDTQPDCFSDLVRISGFSHGTDVWIGNARELIKDRICTLKNAISARDDIMMYLIHHGVDELKSFKIMESVRKGKGIDESAVDDLKAHNVPDWYIDSCNKIKYLFPRAHATAYVIMAYRIAYCKVHYPLAYYAAYLSIRADAFDANEIIKGVDYVKKQIALLDEELNDKTSGEGTERAKKAATLAVLQVSLEMMLRGFKFDKIDIYQSDAKNFIMRPQTNSLLPPFASLSGVGGVAANSIVEARKDGVFSTIDDLRTRAGINKTAIAALQEHGCLQGMDESDQVSLFGF